MAHSFKFFLSGIYLLQSGLRKMSLNILNQSSLVSDDQTLSGTNSFK